MAIPQDQILGAEVIVRQVFVDANTNNQDCFNVWHLRRLTTAVAPNKANLRAAFDAAIVQLQLLGQAEAITATTIGIRWPNDPEDAEDIAAATPLTAGQIALDSLPQQNAATMQLKTALRGKAFRGSKRFAGIPEAHATKGWLNATGAALWVAVRDAINDLITDADSNQWRIAVLSRSRSDFDVVPATLVLNDVVTSVLNRTIGSQDSRKPKNVIV